MEDEKGKKTLGSEGRGVVVKALFQFAINVVVLFALGLFAMNVWSQSAHTLELSRKQLSLVEQARKNDAALNQYLNSGVRSDIEEFDAGRDQISTTLKELPDLAEDADVRRFQSVESDWNTRFARPLITKRRNMDSAKENITQTDMMVFYLTTRADGQQEKFHAALNHLVESANRKAASANSDLSWRTRFRQVRIDHPRDTESFCRRGTWLTFKKELADTETAIAATK